MRLKNGSRLAVLNYIRRNGAASRAQVAAESGLTFMAIQKIIDELASLGLVRRDSVSGGGVGRKSVTFSVNENYAYTLGLHINMFKTSAGAFDLNGGLICERGVDFSSPPSEPSEFIDVLTGTVRDVINGSKIPKEKILGLGIGVPGPVNTEDGSLLTPPNMPVLRYLPLKQIMERELKIPVLLHKDTNAIAMGEYWRGAGMGYRNMMYADADMGIGSGLIFNGGIHLGANSAAGEFGHIMIDPGGPACNCGSRGCLEAMGSGISILKALKRRLADKPEHCLFKHRDSLTIKQVLDAGMDGDPLVLPALHDAAYYMGLGLGNMVNIFDPDIIILGGILVMDYPPYFNVAKETALRKKLPGSRENLIVKSKNGYKAGIIGAGEIVADHFFTSLVSEVLNK